MTCATPVSYTHLNGSLIYNIRPIQEALEQNYQRQFQQAEESVELSLIHI